MLVKSAVVAVVGAKGHTGRFTVAELARRGIPTIPIGRDQANINDPISIDRALDGAGVVVNTAGPFLDTAEPVIEAALRAGIHYLDVTAEQASALSTFERYDKKARSRGIVILPAAGFYGGLGDLLTTAALGDWPSADDVKVFVALDSWRPTEGTRKTGRRNTIPRLVISSGRLVPQQQPARTEMHAFPPPFAEQSVVEVPLSETILISRHLTASEVHNFINEGPLNDLADPATPPPVAHDDRGRSVQVFLMDVVVRRNHGSRRLLASGRDIYAITAPLVVEAAERLVRGAPVPSGCFALGEIFEPVGFLKSLAPDLSVF